MGIPVISEALRIMLFIFSSLWDLIPSKIKLILFLFLIPVIGGFISGIYLNANAYVCDTSGDVYQFNVTKGGTLQMATGVIAQVPFVGPLVAGAIGASTPGTFAIEEARANLVNFEEMRYVSNFQVNLYPCIYPDGTAKPQSDFNPWDQLFVYNPICVPHGPREGEILTIVNDSADGPWELSYDCTNCDVGVLEEDYNDLIYEYCDPVERKDMYAQFFPVTCTADIKPQITMLGIPIFDFRILLMLLVVSILASILIPVLNLQRR